MRKIQRTIVSALIFSKEGKLFQAKKDPQKGEVYPECWHIPGGGIEEGEDKIVALVREIQEEIGVDISPYPIELVNMSEGTSERTLRETGERVMCDMKFNDYKVVLSDKNAEEVSVRLNDEFSEYRWTELSELPMLKVTPPSVLLFKKLGYLL